MKKVKYDISLLILVSFLSLSFNYSGLNDEDQLTQKVKKVISYYYDSKFEITSDDKGVIQIGGDVNTLYDKYRINEIISKIPGISEIENLCNVNVPEISDEEIKLNYLKALNLNASILEPNEINVVVDGGIIRLNGNVTYYREKIMAGIIASWIKGAKDIVNNIQLLPRVEAISDDDLKITLNEILTEHFKMGNNIQLEVNNGVVTLSGQSDNLWIKNEIEKDFLRVIAVKYVINNITVPVLKE